MTSGTVIKWPRSPVAIPETIARHISAPDLFPFQKWRMYSPRLALTFSTRPGREPWELGWCCPLLWLGFTKAPCKRTQQCWPTTPNIVGYHMLRLFAHPPCCMLLEVVAQSLKPVKSLSTWKRTQQLPTMLGVFAHQQWKENKICEGYGSIKVFVFSFFHPYWASHLVGCPVLISEHKTISSPDSSGFLLRPARPGKTLGNWDLSLPENVDVAQLTKQPEDSGYEEHSDEQFI